MDQRKRIDELVEKLNEASHAYYTQGVEIITNYEYDEIVKIDGENVTLSLEKA